MKSGADGWASASVAAMGVLVLVAPGAHAADPPAVATLQSPPSASAVVSDTERRLVQRVMALERESRSRYVGPVDLIPPVGGRPENPIPINDVEIAIQREGGTHARALRAAHTVFDTRVTGIDCLTSLTAEGTVLCCAHYPRWFGMAPPWAGPGDPDDQLVISCPPDASARCLPVARWWP